MKQSKSSSFVVPKVDFSLAKESVQKDGPKGNLKNYPRDYYHKYTDSSIGKENTNSMNRIKILMDTQSRKSKAEDFNEKSEHLITFHSRKFSHAVDSELKVEDLQISIKTANKQHSLNSESTMKVFKDEKSCQTEWLDSSTDSKQNSKDAKELLKEINKWKKAYFQEKQNHKATKDALDQALALSTNLLCEVKTLDVKLYQETEKNKLIANK